MTAQGSETRDNPGIEGLRWIVGDCRHPDRAGNAPEPATRLIQIMPGWCLEGIIATAMTRPYFNLEIP